MRCVTRILFFLGMLLHCFVALAANPPSADEVLEVARKSRLDYIEIVSEANKYVMTLPSKAQVYSYLEILDELKQLGDELEVSSLGGSPFLSFSSDVTTAAIKWSDVRSDSLDDLMTIVKYAQSPARFEFVQVQFGAVRFVSDKDELFRLYSRWGKLVQYLISLRPEHLLLVRFQEFQSMVLGKILKGQQELSHEQLKQVILSAHHPGILQETLEFLQRRVYKSQNPDTLRRSLYLTVVAAGQLKRDGFEVPAYLNSLPGQIAVEVFGKLMRYGASLPAQAVKQTMAVLTFTQIDQVGVMLLQTNPDLLTDAQMPFAEAMSVWVLDFYKANGLVRQKEDLDKFLGKILLRKHIALRSLEGVYSVTMGGEEFSMTVIRSSPTELTIGLSSEYHTYSLFYTLYRRDLGVFEASRFEPGTDSPVGIDTKNYTLAFRFSQDGNHIEGTFSNGASIQKISGERDTQFVNYIARRETGKRDISGTYVGNIDDDSLRTAQITLSLVGDKMAGTLIFNRRENDIHIAFNSGYYRPASNVVYLTSGETLIESHLHFRGQVVGNVLEGQYIIGGMGKVINMRLQKVQ